MTAALEHRKAKSRKRYRILMILDQPFPPDIRVENEASALAKAGFEIMMLISGILNTFSFWAHSYRSRQGIQRISCR